MEFILTADCTDQHGLGDDCAQLSGKIIGAAMEVLNESKPRLDEKLYETCNDHRTEASRLSFLIVLSV
jgi:hypothetical protein